MMNTRLRCVLSHHRVLLKFDLASRESRRNGKMQKKHFQTVWNGVVSDCDEYVRSVFVPYHKKMEFWVTIEMSMYGD